MRTYGRRLRIAGVVLAVFLAACGSESGSDSGSDTGSDTLNLGYFPNVTHAPALVGLEEGLFVDALGADVDLLAPVLLAACALQPGTVIAPEMR